MSLDRRSFLTACSRAGVASALFPGVLYALAAQSTLAQESDSTDQSKPPKITPEMIDQAAIMAGIGPFTAEQKQMMIDGLVDRNGSMKAIRKLKLPNSVAPSFVFHPQPARGQVSKAPTKIVMLAPKAPSTHIGMIGWTADESVTAPPNAEDLAFASVSNLASLLKARKITSVDLTKMYIARLKRYDPKLHFVITLTEDRALAQAKKADEEIAAGRHRGPLHGIPWGAKDLLAVKGHPTTWGAGGFEHQSFDEDATVVQRLDEAGAVLVAKFTLGALAMGDKWFGGRTRNPWNPKQGSSGSSAGSASAVAAGCVAFAIGSETLGSIASPSTRCGDSGLRPSFGLVPRTGAMALSWTMDKLGPICRSAEDCALVLGAIQGQDGKDTSVYPYASFLWDPGFEWRSLRVGYLKNDFDDPKPFKPEQAPATESAEDKKKREDRNAYMQARSIRVAYDHKYAITALDKLKSMGVNLIPVELPKLPYGAMVSMLECEAAAAFDDLTLSGRDKLLTEQSADDWPNSFRTARFFPAVEYIQAARARTLACQQVSALFEKVDIIVAPTESQQLVATNLTGHPALIVPNGFRGPDAPHPPKEDDGNDDNIGGPGTPVSITFLAGLYQDAKLAAFGKAYQEATDFHKQHPKLD
jgi:Asp-tRNA(Asn)/Glu-tRNA(Gln) amidotransferase A subunit family amidase